MSAPKQLGARFSIEQWMGDYDIILPADAFEALRAAFADMQGKRMPAFDAMTAEIPRNVDRELWLTWCAHRKEIGKPLKPTSTKQQLTALSLMADANGAIRHSLASGYQGIFEPKKQTQIGKEESRAAAYRAFMPASEVANEPIDITPPTTLSLGF